MDITKKEPREREKKEGIDHNYHEKEIGKKTMTITSTPCLTYSIDTMIEREERKFLVPTMEAFNLQDGISER